MKILWVTNFLLPDAVSRIVGKNEIKGTGSWMQALVEILKKKSDIHLYIASISPLVESITQIEVDGVIYYVIPQSGSDEKYNKKYENFFSAIYDEVKPDVVHIHGTEYPHSLAALRGCGTKKVLVTIQGLISECAKFFMGGITTATIYKNVTFRDIIKGGPFEGVHEFKRKGVFEIKTIKEAKFIGGRTSWDKAHIWEINPSARYFHCGESLRKEFYEGDLWYYNNCIPHSIFVSQSSHPLKGFHRIIEAVALVKRIYPDVTIKVAGLDITYSNSSFLERLHLSYYGRIIKKLIKKYSLENVITFLGPLNAMEMKKEYLRANVFILSSSIENSPNALAEAQITGVPTLASYVGGVMDMMKGDEESLFRFEETAMLAEKICILFKKGQSVDTSEMRKRAYARHDTSKNISELIGIYKTIAESDK